MQSEFAECLEKWKQGSNAPTKHFTSTSLHPRRGYHLSKAHLLHSTILVEGNDITFDIYSEEGKQQISEEHVFWIRTQSSEIIACYRDQTKDFKELSLQMCQNIWPRVHTKTIGGNQRLFNGITIPIIPQKFFEYKKHNQKKSKLSRHRRKRRRKSSSSSDTTGTITDQIIQEMKRIKKNFHVPPFSQEEIESSVYFRPPGVFTSSSCEEADLVAARPSPFEMKRTRVDHLFHLLEHARDLTMEHKTDEFTKSFQEIQKITDLTKYNHAKELLFFFNYFFPK